MLSKSVNLDQIQENGHFKTILTVHKDLLKKNINQQTNKNKANCHNQMADVNSLKRSICNGKESQLLKPSPSIVGIFNGVVTDKHISREHCQGCKAFDVKGRYMGWIFCKSCGESFHQSCAVYPPTLSHPITGKLPPSSYPQWYWKCPDCRKCEKCKISNGINVLICNYCKGSFCQRCDDNWDAEHGFYFICKNCHINHPLKCLNCKVPISHKERLQTFCSKCSNFGACPRCNGLYSDDNYDEPMIKCDNCDSWTHSICAGISDEEYDKMNLTKWHCMKCEEGQKLGNDESNNDLHFQCEACGDGALEDCLIPNSTDVILLNRGLTKWVHPQCKQKMVPPSPFTSLTTADTWLRSGSLSCYIPQILKERCFVMIKSVWSYRKLGTRTFLQVCLKLDSRGIPFLVELRPFDDFDNSIYSNISLLDGFVRYLRRFPRPDQFYSLPINFEKYFEVERIPKMIEILLSLKSSLSILINTIQPVTKSKKVILHKFETKTLKPYKPKKKVGDLRRWEGCECARIREYHKVWPRPRTIQANENFKLDERLHEINRSRMIKEAQFQVKKSLIAGLGLFTTKPISCGSRIIEYCGQIIGQRVADRREKYYNLLPLRRNDCYLFRLAEDRIIDATLMGNIARFINHSCNPNCESRIERNKIIIYALKDIQEGEELSYDYKFSRDKDDEEPISCFCGSLNCRTFMN